MPDFEDFGTFEDFGSARGSNEVPSIILDGTPVVVCLIPDLLFATRFSDVIVAVHGQPVIVETPDAFVTAMDRYFPVLALLDLNTTGEWADAIQRCKQRPHTSQIPIFAFGSHVDVETLKAARTAGANHAWARSRMVDELPDVVARHVDPPTRELAGCSEGLSEQALLGVEAFNQRDYFEQHEYFETAWLAETGPIREVYRGILQIGVAFLQIERHNWAGAIKMFRRGLPRLRALPALCLDIDLAAFRRAAEVIHLEVTRLGPERLDDFDQGRFPIIKIVEPPPDKNG